MTKYYVTRNIRLGKFAGEESVALDQGAVVEYDGKKLRYKETEDVFPHFDAVLRAGWLSETPLETETPKKKSAAAKPATSSFTVEPEFQVTSSKVTGKSQTPAPKTPKKFVLAGDDDQRIVATGISNKGIPKKTEPVKSIPVLRESIEAPEGTPVGERTFKTPTKSKTLVGK